jgi:hypothetical protein
VTEIVTQPRAGAREAADGRTVGDLLLLLGSAADGAPAASRRGDGGWKRIATHRSWTLAVSGVGPRWTGFPLAILQGRAWSAFLIGELYPLTGGGTAAGRVSEAIDEQRTEVLNGHFALLAWLERERCWRLWTGPFGTLHLHWCRGDGGTAIGTACADVAGAVSRRELDGGALRTLLRYGFMLGDRTHYRDVRLLRPGCQYTFDELGAPRGQRRYWHWSADHGRSPDGGDLAERLDHLLRRVVGDLAADRTVALPISGGLDSRSSFSVLAPKDASGCVASVRAFSYGYQAGSVETSIARQVARARGQEIETFTIEPYLFERLSELTAALEGFQDLTLPRQASIAGRVEADRVLVAHWGDVWLDGLPPREGPVDAAFADARFSKRGAGWLLDHLRGVACDASAQEILREEWRAVEAIEPADLRFKAFKTEQWSFRWTVTSLRAYQSWAFPRLPFYDARLAAFLLSIPAERLAARRLQIEHLRRYAPDLARIKWDAYDTDLYRYRGFDAWLLPRRILARARRTLTGRRPIRRNWEVQFGGAAGRSELERYLLSEARALHEWFAPADIAGLVDDLYRRWPEPGLGYAVSMLVSLGSWLDAR